MNRDGLLDLFVTHWSLPLGHFLARNQGATFTYLLVGNPGGFHSPDDGMGLGEGVFPYTFTGHFTELDDDRFPELLVASDFGQSRVLNNENESFLRSLKAKLSDEHAVGAALFDFDNDGDEDWFVTSIAAPVEFADRPEAKPCTGNRLYQNEGNGEYVEVSENALTQLSRKAPERADGHTALAAFVSA